MNSVTCIKSVTTKKGLSFVKGKTYDFAVSNDGIIVSVSQFENIKIKSEKQFDRFFK